MTKQRRVAIVLEEQDIQWLEQAVLDDDAQAALEFLREVGKPRVDAVLNRSGCKPAFELEFGEELRPPRSPDGS